MASYDIIGNIAIIKPEVQGKKKTQKQKIKEAKELLKNPSVKTVLEKSTEIKGRLRTFKTKHILGEKTLETLHKENNCAFKLNVETCYFSPRQANDRKELAEKIKKSDKVLVMFSGISCYPIVIYKTAKPKKITAIEISRECNKYAQINRKLNKIPEEKMCIIQGDVKKKMPNEKFDVIIMVRPNLKTTFLEQALSCSKRGTKIFYQGFSKESDLPKMIRQLEEEAKAQKKKLKIIDIKKTGDIAPYKFRYRIEMFVA